MTPPQIEMRCPDCDVWGDDPDGCSACGRRYAADEYFELRGPVLDRAARALGITPLGHG